MKFSHEPVFYFHSFSRNPSEEGDITLECAKCEGDLEISFKRDSMSYDDEIKNFTFKFSERECDLSISKVSFINTDEEDVSKIFLRPTVKDLRAATAEPNLHCWDIDIALSQLEIPQEARVSSLASFHVGAPLESSYVEDVVGRLDNICEEIKDEKTDIVVETILDIPIDNINHFYQNFYVLGENGREPLQPDIDKETPSSLRIIDSNTARCISELQPPSSGEWPMTALNLKFQTRFQSSIDTSISDGVMLEKITPSSGNRTNRIDAMNTPSIYNEKVVSQVGIDLADWAVRSNGNVVELLLAPKELGACRFKMVLDGNRLDVDLAVGNPNILHLMRKHVDILIHELKAAGFNQTSINFSEMRTGDNGFSQSRRDDHTTHEHFDPNFDSEMSFAWSNRQNTVAGRLYLKL